MREDPLAAILRTDGFRALVNPLHSDHVESIQTDAAFFVQAGVLLLLLIGCVNVVNLLLILAGSRAREVAIRQSLARPGGRSSASPSPSLYCSLCWAVAAAWSSPRQDTRLLQTLGVDQLPLGEYISLIGAWR